MKSGIYQIINKYNGKMYVGLSCHLEKREEEHFNALRNNNHFNEHLQRAYNKFGKDAFEFSILEYCPKEKLREKEKYWIRKKDAYKNGYNMTLGGDGVVGYHPSKELIAKRGESIKKNYEEHPERRERIREVTREYWRNEEHRSKRIKHLHEAMQREEYRKKLSAAGKKNWADPNFRNNQAKRFIAASHSPEVQKRRSESVKQTYLNDPLLRARIGENSRRNWENEEYREKTAISRNAVMQTQEYKDKMAVITTELWKDSDYRDKAISGMRESAEKRARPILQVETGTVFQSINDAAKSVGAKRENHIGSCCNGRSRTAYGYHWRYAQDTDEDWRARRDRYLSEKGIKGYQRIVCVETGEIFWSATEAAAYCGKSESHIIHVCAGDGETAGGFHWRYEGTTEEEFDRRMEQKAERRMKANDVCKKRVRCVETGEVFDSYKEAAKEKGLISGSSISNCLRGMSKTAGGLHWEKA